MPIIVRLKEPDMSIILDGELEDDADKWDEIFHKSVLIAKSKGQTIIIPITQDSNIAFMNNVTQEEIDKVRSEAEARRSGAQNIIEKPRYMFPGGRKH